MLAEWRASEDTGRSGEPLEKKLRRSRCSCLLKHLGVGEEREEDVPSQAEFFTGIIFSLVSPDTILKNSVLSTYWITHRVFFFPGAKP